MPTVVSAPPTAQRQVFQWQRFWYLPIYAIYLVLLIATSIRHEPWFDEAQAWLLARDASPWTLFTQILRYEGSPGLWHYLLMVPAKLHFPYATLNVISALVAAAGVLLLLHRSPMPKYLTALIPFTFFIAYQYAVVARSYVLLPLLMFGLATVYPRRMQRPWPFIGMLALVGNVSTHGLIIAFTLFCLHGVEVLLNWKRLQAEERKQQLYGAAAFIGMLLVLVYVLWTPKDITFATGYHRSFLAAVKFGMWVLKWAYTEADGPAIFIVVASLCWFAYTRVLASYLLPTIGLLALFSLKYYNCWHEGTLVVVWLFALWRSFAMAREMQVPRKRLLLHQMLTVAMVAAVLLFCGVQMRWTYYTMRHDLTAPYSGCRAVASYLKAHGLQNKRIVAIAFHTAGILPYFDHNVFLNFANPYNASFWLWSQSQRYQITLDDLAVVQPDLIIMGVKFKNVAQFPWGDPRFVPWAPPGYRYVEYFDGKLYWKTRVKEYDAYVLYERE